MTFTSVYMRFRMKRLPKLWWPRPDIVRFHLRTKDEREMFRWIEQFVFYATPRTPRILSKG